MKLRNKKTREIPDKIEAIAYIQWSKMIMMVYINNDGERIVKQYDSLETFNEEWEDYEEPKTYYYISDFGAIRQGEVGKFVEDEIVRKEIGNYFETEEEAEKAVKKLETWKRLKACGFKFTFWDRTSRNGDAELSMLASVKEYMGFTEDLDLLFGGEE